MLPSGLQPGLQCLPHRPRPQVGHLIIHFPHFILNSTKPIQGKGVTTKSVTWTKVSPRPGLAWAWRKQACASGSPRNRRLLTTGLGGGRLGPAVRGAPGPRGGPSRIGAPALIIPTGLLNSPSPKCPFLTIVRSYD